VKRESLPALVQWHGSVGICVRKNVGLCLLAACLLSSPVVAHAEWQAVEKAETYAIDGQSGPELYASIGQRGPELGKVRAIAHTNFKLTWTRDYEPRGDACVLVSARPKLTITYTLPKPSGKLPAAVQKNWEIFIAGVSAHEKVHGQIIEDMVRRIEAFSVGLSVADDPRCTRIRTELTKRLSELSLAQRQRSRDFDRTELGQGGNLQQLVLALVNGR
jgi:predicted secreted Zn-dependent protease